MPKFKQSEDITLTSGVTVQVAPFPAALYNKIQIKSLEDFPDPEPPKKTVEVVDGTEEVDDLENPEYLEAKRDAERSRLARFAEAVVEVCVDVDLDTWKGEIKGGPDRLVPGKLRLPPERRLRRHHRERAAPDAHQQRGGAAAPRVFSG